MGATPKVDITGRPVALRDVDLDAFFHPRTIAVVGVTDSAHGPMALWRKIRAWGEAAGAAVWPVNPKRDEIDGVTCYPSVLDIPGDVDLACLLVGSPLDVLPQVIEKKVGFAVVFAAGFAETGDEGEAKQVELERLIGESDLRLLGPNTNLNAFEIYRDDLPGKAIALITQSGHQGRPVFQGQELGIRLSHWAPTGNEADLEFADFAAYFAAQPEIGAIASYIEGFKDGRTLMLAADAAARAGVPIVTVKVGRTAEGRSMAKAHTGHLTGADDVVAAVFRQFGVTRVDGLDELLDVAAMFARTKPPAGDANGVCVYSISGGTGAHMADLCAAAGLRLPELTAPTQRRLHEWIPPYLRVSNPVDSGGPPVADERGRKILDAIVADPNVALLLVPITGALESMSAPFARDLVDVAQTTDKPVLVVWGSPVGNEPAYRDILLRSQVPVFRTFANAVRAARAYFDYHDFRRGYRSAFDKPVLRPSPAAKKVARPVRSDEWSSMAVLDAYGIPTPRRELVSSAKEAVRAADALGLPVVLKACGADLLHKSDAGLVKVGLTSAREVRTAYAALAEAAPSMDGVIVAELVPPGVETVVGVSRDELFGPVAMFGIGGVFVEVLRDVTFRVPPFSTTDARRMLTELKGAAVLDGVRGGPRCDRRALVDVIMKVQRLAVDLAGELSELDINPLVAHPKGCVALDALVVPTDA